MNSTGLSPAEIAHADQFQAAAHRAAVYAGIVRDQMEEAGFDRFEAVLIANSWLQHALRVVQK